MGQLRVALRQLGAADGLTGEGTEMNSRLIGQLEEVCACVCGITSAGSKSSCLRFESGVLVVFLFALLYVFFVFVFFLLCRGFVSPDRCDNSRARRPVR